MTPLARHAATRSVQSAAFAIRAHYTGGAALRKTCFMQRILDMSTPTGRLLVHMISALAEFERELIRGRVRAGLDRVMATGKTKSGRAVGRPRRNVDADTVHALRAEGRSWRAIAQALKVPRRTLERAYRLAHNVEPGNDAAH